MEVWIKGKPKYGDHIRVNRGLYYHHGIYAFDDEVYAFESPVGSEIRQETAEVLKTTLESFLKGGELEIRQYDLEEEKRKRSGIDTVVYARAHLGEKGYNLVTNNCEHFANRCVFGESKSTQVNMVEDFLRGLFQ